MRRRRRQHTGALGGARADCEGATATPGRAPPSRRTAEPGLQKRILAGTTYQKNEQTKNMMIIAVIAISSISSIITITAIIEII